MKTRLVEGVELYRGSGNMSACFFLADTEKLKINIDLVIKITKPYAAVV